MTLAGRPAEPDLELADHPLGADATRLGPNEVEQLWNRLPRRKRTQPLQALRSTHIRDGKQGCLEARHKKLFLLKSFHSELIIVK